MKYRILGVAVLFLSFHLPALAQGQGQRPNLNPEKGQTGGNRGRGEPVTPPRPTPHFPDGRVNFRPVTDETGLWFPIDTRLAVPNVGMKHGPDAGPNALR